MSSRLWDQLVGEPAYAYEAFASYRDAPTPRPAPDKFASMHGLKMAETLHFAHRFQWQQRAKSYDKHFEKIREEHRIEAIRGSVGEVEAAHLEIMRAARNVLHIEVLKLIRESQNSPRSILRSGDLFRLLDYVVKNDRLLAGKATTIVESPIDFESMSDEDFNRLEEITTRNKAH